MPLQEPDRGDAESTLSLVRRASDGDDVAQNRLLTRYRPRFLQWARGRLPGYARSLLDTEDLVQETLFKAMGRLPHFKPLHNGGFFGYLRRALLNRIRDEMRVAERRRMQELPASLVDNDATPLDQMIEKEDRDRYERALETLSAKQREAIILRFELRLKFGEVAEVLGCPSDDAARMRVSRALVKLAEAMREDAGHGT